MVEKVKIPEFIKEWAKSALEPLNRLEERIKGMLKKMASEKNISTDEMKKTLKDALGWVSNTRSDIEKAFSEGLAKTLSLLNLPSREELLNIDKKVNKLAKDLKELEGKVTGKKVARKPAVKKAAKKAVN